MPADRPYEPQAIEQKWQAVWEAERLYSVSEDTGKPKKYVLEMFPYPSGDIHMGHVRNYTIGDVVARYFTMRGFEVLHPIGWDAFGLPAENAAIKSSTHPAKWTYANIEKQTASFKRMGFSYDWDRKVVSCDVDYYRWGQWIFLKFWERGLVERRKSPVNWCPDCKTVLANEQVIGDGVCWRCKSVVEKRELEQWFFKITEYADELLDDLDKMPGWPERVKTMQANWIGRSQGAEVEFTVCDPSGEPTDERITVFTTRPDTLFGCSFFLLAPEHPLVREFVAGTEYEADVMRVVNAAARESAVERSMGEREKNGAFTGRYVVNPVNGEKVPVWVADYVLMEYGTGAVMAVPCGDQRDFDFARKYGLPIPPVVVPEDDPLAAELRDTRERVMTDVPWPSAYDGPGIMVQSGEFTGMPGGKDSEGMRAVTRWLDERDQGRSAINYRLRDWLISRQRYWGNPIPAVHCPTCGLVPVPEDQLPVVLPMDVDITKGETLADHPEFYETTCPEVRRCRSARDRHDGHVHVLVVVLPALLRRAQRLGDLGHREDRLLDAGRPVHRRHRARDPAPAVLALLHEGLPRHGAGEGRRAVHEPSHAGHGEEGRRDDVEVQGQRRRARGDDRAARRGHASRRTSCSWRPPTRTSSGPSTGSRGCTASCHARGVSCGRSPKTPRRVARCPRRGMRHRRISAERCTASSARSPATSSRSASTPRSRR